ncbi:unnamed protein product, partial [Iphiclides podalirius]
MVLKIAPILKKKPTRKLMIQKKLWKKNQRSLEIMLETKKVLICLTGGKSSTVLLDLIFNGLSQDNHKKLRIIPFFLHLTGIEQKEHDLKTAELIIRQCQHYNFNIYVVNISKFYLQNNNTLPEQNSTTEIINWTVSDPEANIKEILKKLTPTTSNDVEKRIKRDIFIRVASELQCKYIFTAETTTTLAINLLSNLVIGRGSQVENDVGFSDNRHENIKILRPMKDITEEELHHYIKVNKLNSVSTDHIRKNSLQSTIKTFVSDLQENFPATISTVCKTADKISSTENNPKRCQMCKSYFNMMTEKMTAIQATIFSRTVSNCQPSEYYNVDQNTNVKSPLDHHHHKTSMFPYIDNKLCYSCSKNYLERGLQDIFEIKSNP